MTTTLPPTRRSRTRLGGSSGEAVLFCQAQKPASRPKAAATEPSVVKEVQPCTGASMRAYTKVARPAVLSAAPSRSSRAPELSRDSGMSSSPATSAMTTTGTLIQKTDAQVYCSRSTPPTTGPSGMPTDAPPAQMAMARP
jgi:hypothetical protein